MEKETSGALQSSSPTSKATGAVPGGPFQTPAVMIPSPPPYALRFLIALITKAN